MKPWGFLSALLFALPLVAGQEDDEPEASWPALTSGNFVINNFRFDSGEKLDKLKLHYETMGKLRVDEDGKTNAVLVMHGNGGEIDQFLNEDYAAVLFNKGQILDAEEYYIIFRDTIGHGESSSPRSTGLHAGFPKYQYSDMVRFDHQLLTEHLGVKHTRLITGVSMGGMLSWVWGEEYPDFMDALFPVASFPKQIGGHNRMWRKMFIENILRDPAWKNGDYEEQPSTGLVASMSLLLTMFENPVHMAKEYPTRDDADRYLDSRLEALLENIDLYDANNIMYAYNPSYTYDPEPRLGSIKSPITAVNTYDDLMNPGETRILETTTAKGLKPGLGKAVTIPASDKNFGHGSYLVANLWKNELSNLLARSGTVSSKSGSARFARDWKA